MGLGWAEPWGWALGLGWAGPQGWAGHWVWTGLALAWALLKPLLQGLLSPY